MFKHIREIATFMTGIFLVLFGSILVFTPSIVSAEPPAQRDPFTDSACLNCHTDQQQLRDLTAENEADEPDESSLSSGPG